ncbi:MAG TPA: Dak phosphatase, partial [Micromonosporaceae bacterium]|nr:Dak phosphatase [Micromonosporaceae bacterium]
AAAAGAAAPAGTATPAAPAARGAEPSSYAYEVQFLLDAEPAAVERLRATLSALGDSLVIVGTGAQEGTVPTWNVHVHVDDIGAAIEAAVTAGRPYQISVTRFADQMAPTPDVPPPGRPPAGVALESASDSGSQFDPDGRAAVVVAAGDGLAALLTAEGAVVVGASPSIGDMLDAIRSTRAGRVVVLPNDPDTQAVARAAAQEAAADGARVSVVPTRSPVQALAALAVRDPGRAFDDDVIAMAEAAGACRYAEVCYAGREAITMAGRCRPGDLLALMEGEVHLIGADLVEICQTLLDRLLGGGGELVTLLLGADAPADLADELTAHVAQGWPFVEVNSYWGGQPHYPLLVGVE